MLVLALSDVLDGWLARRYDWQTDLGRVLDPVTDRLLFLVLVAALLLFGDAALVGGRAGDRPRRPDARRGRL